ncbi:hypothetical protein DFH06DRAFT_372358 [Mycena polygramma]|nr:hypothetical protein DFH06DRAFT_372358 [Mycena polygramma]
MFQNVHDIFIRAPLFHTASSPRNDLLQRSNIVTLRRPGPGGWHQVFWWPGISGAGETVLLYVSCFNGVHLSTHPATYPNRLMVVKHSGIDSNTRKIDVACLYMKHMGTDIQPLLICGGSLCKKPILWESRTAMLKTLYLQNLQPRSRLSQSTGISIFWDSDRYYPWHSRHILWESFTTINLTVKLTVLTCPHINSDMLVPSPKAIGISEDADNMGKYVGMSDTQRQQCSFCLTHSNTQSEQLEKNHYKSLKNVDAVCPAAELCVEHISVENTSKVIQKTPNNSPKNLVHLNGAQTANYWPNKDVIKMGPSALFWITDTEKLWIIPQLHEAPVIDPGGKPGHNSLGYRDRTRTDGSAGVNDNLHVTCIVHYTDEDIVKKLIIWLQRHMATQTGWGQQVACLDALHLLLAKAWTTLAQNVPRWQLITLDFPDWQVVTTSSGWLMQAVDQQQSVYPLATCW